MLVSLGMIGLASCKTIEIAHDPLECLPQPETSLSDRLTDDELNSFSEEVFEVLEIHIITYQERFKTQCDLINKHNQDHKASK